MILRFLSPSVPSPLFTHEIQTASTESSPVVLLPNKKQHVKASFSLSPLSSFSRCFAVTSSNSSAFPFTPIFKSLSSGIIFRSSHTGTVNLTAFNAISLQHCSKQTKIHPSSWIAFQWYPSERRLFIDKNMYSQGNMLSLKILHHGLR